MGASSHISVNILCATQQPRVGCNQLYQNAFFGWLAEKPTVESSEKLA